MTVFLNIPLMMALTRGALAVSKDLIKFKKQDHRSSHYICRIRILADPQKNK